VEGKAWGRGDLTKWEKAAEDAAVQTPRALRTRRMSRQRMECSVFRSFRFVFKSSQQSFRGSSILGNARFGLRPSFGLISAFGLPRINIRLPSDRHSTGYGHHLVPDSSVGLRWPLPGYRRHSDASYRLTLDTAAGNRFNPGNGPELQFDSPLTRREAELRC